MKPAGAVAAIALTMTVAACSSGTSTGAALTGAAVDQAGTPSTLASSTTVSQVEATVVGRFVIAGGPYPGTPHPIDGTISIHAGTTSGRVVKTLTTKHGRFTVSLTPGRYSFVGRSGQLTQNGPGCSTYKPIRVTSGQTAHVTVQCDVP